MFHQVQSDKKHIFVNNIKLDRKKESKTTPHVNVKVSAYDKVVQLVTNYNTEVKKRHKKNQNREYI